MISDKLINSNAHILFFFFLFFPFFFFFLSFYFHHVPQHLSRKSDTIFLKKYYLFLFFVQQIKKETKDKKTFCLFANAFRILENILICILLSKIKEVTLNINIRFMVNDIVENKVIKNTV